MEGFDRRKFLKGSSVAVGMAGAMTVLPGAIPALAKSTQGRGLRLGFRSAQTTKRTTGSLSTQTRQSSRMCATRRKARSTCSSEPGTSRCRTEP